MSKIVFYSITKPSVSLPSTFDADKDTLPEGFEYALESQLPECQKPYAESVTIHHRTLDLFPVLSQLCGFKVTSCSSRFHGSEFVGYSVQMPDGTMKDVLNETLDAFRVETDSPGYIFSHEYISDSEGWYYSSEEDGIVLDNGPLTEGKLIQAMLFIAKENSSFYSEIGELLFAIVKAIAAVREGKTVFAEIF